MTRASDVEQAAATWLVRREQPGWSATDSAELEAWLDESLAHKAAFWRLEAGWAAADRLGATGLQEHARPRWIAQLVAVAASLLVVCMLGTLALPDNTEGSPDLVRVATAVGARKQVAFTDGSRVMLNTASALRASVARGDRQVWLDRGEAFFDIAHDPRRPFTVFAGMQKVTVLGTKFSIRRDGDTTVVVVAQGRVRVEDSAANDERRMAVIAAGDVAVTHGDSILLAKRSDQWVEDSLSWRQGVLTFDRTTLGDAIREFNRYNRRQIHMADPKAEAIRIGGSFNVHDVDAFARLLHTAFGLRVRSDENGITINS